MGTMKDIDVSGRGLIKGRVTVRPEETGLVVEVDDEENTGVHLRIAIDRQFLYALLGSIDFKATEEAAGRGDEKRKPAKIKTTLILPDIPPLHPDLPDIPPTWPGC